MANEKISDSTRTLVELVVKDEDLARIMTLAPTGETRGVAGEANRLREKEAIAMCLTQLAQMLVVHYARGGLMVDGDTIARLEEVAGPISKPADLIPLVERAMKRKDGQVVYSFTVDPFHAGDVERQAEASSITGHQVVQEVIDQVLAKGWLYDWDNEPMPLALTREQAKEMKQMIGVPEDEPLRGADVFAFIKEVASETLVGVGAETPVGVE